jgi:hypothetical protein
MVEKDLKEKIFYFKRQYLNPHGGTEENNENLI